MFSFIWKNIFFERPIYRPKYFLREYGSKMFLINRIWISTEHTLGLKEPWTALFIIDHMSGLILAQVMSSWCFGQQKNKLNNLFSLSERTSSIIDYWMGNFSREDRHGDCQETCDWFVVLILDTGPNRDLDRYKHDFTNLPTFSVESLNWFLLLLVSTVACAHAS